MSIYHRFSFVAARSLPHMPPSYRCSRLHGHTFKIEVRLKGVVNAKDGWLYDHYAIADAVQPLIDQLDHRYLNDIDGMDNKPSNETIAVWFWQRIKPKLPLLSQITVIDTDATGCIYNGEDNEQG
ncbi:MAG: 6-pyruvoyl tetrahydropterin synthase family protein [Alphaproteobacteria bacterium GM202ARS2]|nr:6-pyruvoyl tetrahydropterin synthase family protein [Alphaproteobacteria bacterium GM202ARS2]